jgi:hypothetical protein
MRRLIRIDHLLSSTLSRTRNWKRYDGPTTLPFNSTMSQAAIVKDGDVVMGDPEDESSDVEMSDARDCAVLTAGKILEATSRVDMLFAVRAN